MQRPTKLEYDAGRSRRRHARNAQHASVGAAADAHGAGTVSSIDPDAGTVNISHGPVASANWPAMTMSFELANPSSASGIEPGQRVDFKFTIAGGMDATVTEIKRVE